MNEYIKRSIWLAVTVLCGLVIALPAQAASFDCAKAATKVEKLICSDAGLSKLDEALNEAYKTALQDGKQTDAVKQAQKRWMKERNGCADANCVRRAYIKRNEQLREVRGTPAQPAKIATTEQSKTGSGNVEAKDSSDPSAFKGEYILIRAFHGYSVCHRFKDNLNRFRKLDFDQCNPRLSDKFPEFSRPEWKEIPFDMALAEKAIRSTTDHSGYNPAEYPEDAEYHRKEGEERWKQWKKGSEPFRAAGKAHMWLTKIDMDGDGKEDTILRMMPGGRYPIDPERPSLWSCDYNIGELYVLESGNPQMAASFNLHASWASDIVRYAEDNHYYLLSWEAAASSALNGWFNQQVPDIGGTRGVTIRNLYRDNPENSTTPGTMCLIDWVPTGHFIPAPKPQRKHVPATH